MFVDVTKSFMIYSHPLVIAGVENSSKKERRNLALLLLHVRWIMCRAKANVTNQRSR
jgi:hypothetical protein